MIGDSAAMRVALVTLAACLCAEPALALSPRCTLAANAFNRVSVQISAQCAGRGYQPRCAPIYRQVVRRAQMAVAVCSPELPPNVISGMQAFIARGQQAMAEDAARRRMPRAAMRHGRRPGVTAPMPAATASAPVVERDSRLPVRVAPAVTSSLPASAPAAAPQPVAGAGPVVERDSRLPVRIAPVAPAVEVRAPVRRVHAPYRRRHVRAAASGMASSPAAASGAAVPTGASASPPTPAASAPRAPGVLSPGGP